MWKDVFPLPGGGRVGSVDSSLAQLAVPEGRDPPQIPFHPLHEAYLEANLCWRRQLPKMQIKIQKKNYLL